MSRTIKNGNSYFYSIVVDFFMEIINGLTEMVTQKDADVKGSKALHNFNAYSSNYGMCIGQVFLMRKVMKRIVLQF